MTIRKNLFRLFILMFAFSARAQFISFEDSLFEARPYQVRGLDPVDQYYLDQVNNQALPDTQKLTFLRNCRSDIQFFKRTSGFGNTYFENEKAAYPHCMHSMIYGMGRNESAFIRPAKEFMQAKAIYDIGSTLTDTVDLFPSFTLKGQVPKYFYFGQFARILDSTYLAKMRKAMGLWTFNGSTPTDPLLRPNPFYVGNTGCYDCQCRNSWVDTRNTDNLKAMRETSAYLFSEEIGNGVIRDLYSDRIRNHVGALWNVGYSEWDSETYVSHAFGPFFNLFAFTRSEPMKKMAKAALDWYMMAASVKYFQGMSTGPSKRSNGSSNIRLGAGASDIPYLYFGDEEVPDSQNVDRDRDTYITFLSGYRPPQAIRQLALKEIRLPSELRNTKPPYGSFNPTSANRPDAFETMFNGKSYQLGTVVSTGPVNDMRPFKMGIRHNTRGVDVFYANTTDTDTLTHAKFPGDQIGQFENLMAFLHKNDGRKFFFQLPGDVILDSVNGVWFFPYSQAWVAVRPINLSMISIQPLNGIYRDHKMILANTGSGTFSGFALEVADSQEYPTYEEFKAAVLSRPFSPQWLADSQLIRIEGKNGKFLKVKYNPTSLLPVVYRNSSSPVGYNGSENFNVYQSITPPVAKIQSLGYDGQNLNFSVLAYDSLWGPVFENWKRGILKVLSNDFYFEGRYNSVTGDYYWKESPATDALRKGTLALLQVYAGFNLIHSIQDSLTLAQGNWNLNLPFGQSGTFSFRLRVVDEEGNEAWSEPVVQTITSSSRRIKPLEIQLLPNPSEGKVTLQGQDLKEARVEVYSVDGHSISSFQWNPAEPEFDVSSWKRGLYFIRIRTEKGERNLPFIRN